MSEKDADSGTDDEEYVPTDPEEDEDGDGDGDAVDEDGAASDDDDDDDDDGGNDDDATETVKSVPIATKETAKRKSSSSSISSETDTTATVTVDMSKVPKYSTESVDDDIFPDSCEKRDIPVKRVSETTVIEKGKPSRPSLPSGKRKSGNGLTDAISALSKKSKMSILDKTAQDWGAFKDETGIQEELSSHNRGKQGYVERLEFLTRTDYRQFEMERNARNAMRTKK